MAGRDLLKRGLLWKVGNGKSIKIWEDPWLNYHFTNKILPPTSILPPQSTVSALIINQPPEWNVDLIRRLFFDEETEAITRIILSRVNREDKLV